VPLFAGLSKRHLRRLAKLAGETTVRRGSFVVQAGQPGRAFFVILEGRAKVVRGTFGSGRTMAALGAGDFFGELALLDGGPRTASVVAETDLVAVRLPRTAFRQMLKAEPDVAVKLLEKLASIVRKQSPPASE
jgi:CRP-like cAMP-binding protein